MAEEYEIEIISVVICDNIIHILSVMLSLALVVLILRTKFQSLVLSLALRLESLRVKSLLTSLHSIITKSK